MTWITLHTEGTCQKRWKSLSISAKGRGWHYRSFFETQWHACMLCNLKWVLTVVWYHSISHTVCIKTFCVDEDEFLGDEIYPVFNIDRNRLQV